MANGSLTLTEIVLSLIVLVAFVTCDDNANPTTVLTYNTGLTTTVHGYDDRRGSVVQAVKSQSDADFMCLQELWFEDDLKSVVDEMEQDYPHHFSPIHADVSLLREPSSRPFWKPAGWDTTSCSSTKLIKLFACYGWYCSNTDNEQKCLVENCEKDIFDLSPSCRSCFSGSSSGGSTIWAKCANVFKEFNRQNRPGLLVLSKQPLTSVEYVNYHEGYPVLMERGYIKAQVEGGQTYVCTHLTAVFSYYFEVKLTKFSSFLEELEAEIRHVNSTFFTVPHVLLGDLNTGPERNAPGLPKIQGEAAAIYDILVNEMNYQNPYMQNNGNCTYCPSENSVLQADNVQYGDVAIDFVMTSAGVTADVTSARRVLDSSDVMLSDHYGVKVDIYQP